MSAYEVLFGVDVAAFFTGVGVASAAVAWALGGSPLLTALVALGALLVTAFNWIVFAPYSRDIWQMPLVVFKLTVTLVRTTAKYVFRGFKPEFPEWTFKFELTRAAMRTLRGGVFAENVCKSHNSRYFNKQFELLGKRVGPNTCKSYGTKMETVTFNGLEHVWIRDHERSATSPPKDRFVVLYYHGGGFVLFTPHFFVDLGNRVRSAIMKIIHEQHPEMKNVSVEVFLANYRKSPDYQYPVPQEDAVTAFEHLVESEQLDPSRIVVMGDSAGGGLCLSTMLRLKAKGGRQPGGALLSCPFMGLNPGQHYDDSHCVFALELGRAMAKAFHPKPDDPELWKDAAAVYCDLSGLPPAIIQIGSVDTIYPGAIQLYEKAKADGLGKSWELDVFTHMPHAFTILKEALLPDVKHGIDHLAAFAVRVFSRA